MPPATCMRYLKSDKAFFVFSRQHPIRRFAIATVQSRVFQFVALCMIVANCVTLATMDPCETTYDTSSLIIECPTPKCFWLRSIDAIVLVFFTIEMLLKMMALCVVGHRAAYLADGWNRLDALIVLLGACEYFFSSDKSSNVTLLRLVRVLRPLRAIRRIPNLRLLVTLLFDTLTALSNVCIIVVFVYFVFGITGLQLWAGVLRQRCYLQPEHWLIENSTSLEDFSGSGQSAHFIDGGTTMEPNFLESGFLPVAGSGSGFGPDLGLASEQELNDSAVYQMMPDFYTSQSHPHMICGGYFQCSNGVEEFDREEPLCNAIFPEGNKQCNRYATKYTECRSMASNPNGVSFDNIGAAWVTIFQAVSLEGWTDIMYMVQDGHTFWVWPYFILLVIFGSFATTNLCFVVIATQIPQTKRKLAIAIRNEKLGLAPQSKLFPNRSTITSHVPPSNGPGPNRNIARRFSKFPSTASEWSKHFHYHPPAPDVGVYTQVVDYIMDLLAFFWHRSTLWASEMFEKHVKKRRPEGDVKTEPEKDQNGHTVADCTNGEVTDRQNAKSDDESQVKESRADSFQLIERDPFMPVLRPSAYSTSTSTNIEHTVIANTPQNSPLDERKASKSPDEDFATALESIPLSPDSEIVHLKSESPQLPSQQPLAVPLKATPSFNFVLEEAAPEEPRNSLHRLKDRIEHAIYVTRVWFHCAVDHTITHWLMAILIILNTICLATEHHNQPQSLTHTVEIVSLIVTIVFAIEFVAKLLAMGFYSYIRDGFNMVDAVILVISIMELVESARAGLSVLRTFRLIRFLKLLRFFPTLQRQLTSMLRTLDNIATFLLLLGLFFLIFSMIGMSLFGCRYYNAEQQTTCRPATEFGFNEGIFFNETLVDSIGEKTGCKRWKAFDSPLSSLLTVLQILTQDDGWSQVMRDAMQNVGPWAAVYFVLLVVFGSYVLLSMLLAIIEVGLTRNFGHRKSSIYSPASKADRKRKRRKRRQKSNKESESERHAMQGALSVANGPAISKASTLPNGTSINSPTAVSTSASNPQILPTIDEPKNDRRFTFSDIDGHPESKEPCLKKPDERRESALARLVTRFQVVRTSISQRMSTGRFSKEGNYSLFIFPPENLFRRKLFEIVTSMRFDQMVLVVIFLNCMVVAFERPTIASNSYERIFLDNANHAFNTFFIVEACLKIVAEGFIYGPNTYLRNGWNIFDFCLVSLSLIEFLIEINEARFATAAIKALHILRLFHTFRPLRAINRAPGLKMVIKTLATTIRPIGTIMMITLCIFFVFSILGVQLYRGCFYKCRFVTEKAPGLSMFLKKRRLLWTPTAGQTILINSSYPSTYMQSFSRTPQNESLVNVLSSIRTKEECLEHEGLEWTNEENNFDSLGHALMTLFVLLSFDGWKDIAQNGLNCVGIDKQPLTNYNPWHLVFFMSFLMINGFCLVDMFAGVVVNNYAKVKEALEKETYQKLDAVRDVEGLESVSVSFVRRRGGLAPQLDEARLQYWERYPPWRLRIHKLCTNRYFEISIELTVGLNILAMAVEHYQMPHELKIIVSVVNLIVLLAFIFEAFVRLVAFGPKRYFRDKWHWLDITIIVASVVGTLFETIDSRLLPINPSLIRAARVCRVTRIFRLVKMAYGIQGLFQTVLAALPQVGNLSLLLMLLFFIYGSLGVEIFGKLEAHHKPHGLSRHANFHNVGMSILTLFRIATGDRWHELLNDVLFIVSKPYCMQEVEALPTSGQNSTATDNDSSNVNPTVCSIVSLSVQFYFVSFILLVQFVLINIVVTVLMRQLEEADRKEIFERARQKMAKHEESLAHAARDAAHVNYQAHASHQLSVNLRSEHGLMMTTSDEEHDTTSNVGSHYNSRHDCHSSSDFDAMSSGGVSNSHYSVRRNTGQGLAVPVAIYEERHSRISMTSNNASPKQDKSSRSSTRPASPAKSILKSRSKVALEPASPAPEVRFSTRSLKPVRRPSVSCDNIFFKSKSVGTPPKKKERLSSPRVDEESDEHTELKAPRTSWFPQPPWCMRRRSSTLPAILRVHNPVRFDGKPLRDDSVSSQDEELTSRKVASERLGDSFEDDADTEDMISSSDEEVTINLTSMTNADDEAMAQRGKEDV